MTPQAVPGRFVARYTLANVGSKFTGRAVLCGCPIQWVDSNTRFVSDMTQKATDLIQGRFSPMTISVRDLETYLGYDLTTGLAEKPYQISLP